MLGGLAAIAAGFMLFRELRKKNHQQQAGITASPQVQVHRRGQSPRGLYQLDDVQRAPAELPDSPTSADGQTMSPISPISPISPLSSLPVDQTDRRLLGDDVAR